MKDSFGTELNVGDVVEISGAYGKQDNATWVVDSIYSDGSAYLHRLNKNMTKAKSNPVRGWPLESFLNDRFKNAEINSYNKENAKIKYICKWVEPAKKEPSNKIYIQKRGIKKGDNYCSCYYYLNNDGSITVLARHYNEHIPRELGDVRNDTDRMTDYFDTDSLKVTKDNPYYRDFLRCIE